MTTPHELALLRLVAQGIAGPRAATAGEVVRRLTAMQGQDYPSALRSVALRTAAGRREDVEAALDDGEVVRSWTMRGTLHLLAAEDLPWQLELSWRRALAAATARHAQLRLTDADVERARECAAAALAGGRRLRRAALLAALTEGGLDVSAQRGYHLLWVLALTGSLCLGPTDDGEQLFVLADEWVRAPRRLDREEALAELTRRFFAGHGPATVADLARWAALPLRDVRAGLALARPHLAALDVDGVEHLLDPATADRLAGCRAEARGVFLLPGFDEFVLGYRDRRAVLDPAFAGRVDPGGNGVFRPTVVHDGRIVGTWQHTGRGAERPVVATPFTAFDDGVEQAIAEAAAALP
jgi:hypothetical protein